MPFLLFAAGAAGIGGFVLGKGTEGVGTTVKWVVIGGVAFLIAKQAKIV